MITSLESYLPCDGFKFYSPIIILGNSLGNLLFLLALPQFFKSSGDEKVGTTQADKFPKL
jgi:hypothetical protein